MLFETRSTLGTAKLSIFAVNAAADLQGESECNWNSYHLPSSMQPSQYNMALSVDLQPPYQIRGQMEIAVNVKQQSSCMVLHAMGMSLSNVKRLDTGEAGECALCNIFPIPLVDFVPINAAMHAGKRHNLMHCKAYLHSAFYVCLL